MTRHTLLPPRRNVAEVTEKQFQQQVTDLAEACGWEHYHAWLSIHSPTGWPDLALVKPPRLVFAELKSEKGKLTAQQRRWIGLLEQCPGVEVYCWWPSDWEQAVEVLRR
jgi:hypothetical protein